MFCTSCGSTVKEGQRFCTKCGSPLEGMNPEIDVNGDRDTADDAEAVSALDDASDTHSVESKARDAAAMGTLSTKVDISVGEQPAYSTEQTDSPVPTSNSFGPTDVPKSRKSPRSSRHPRAKRVVLGATTLLCVGAIGGFGVWWFTNGNMSAAPEAQAEEAIENQGDETESSRATDSGATQNSSAETNGWLGLFGDSKSWSDPEDPSGRFTFTKTSIGESNTCIWAFNADDGIDKEIAEFVNEKVEGRVEVMLKWDEAPNAISTMPAYIGKDFISVVYVSYFFDDGVDAPPRIKVDSDFFFGDKAIEPYGSMLPIPSEYSPDGEEAFYAACDEAHERFAEKYWKSFGYRVEDELLVAVKASHYTSFRTEAGYCQISNDIYVTDGMGKTIHRPVCFLIIPCGEGQPGDEVDFGLWDHVAQTLNQELPHWKIS